MNNHKQFVGIAIFKESGAEYFITHCIESNCGSFELTTFFELLSNMTYARVGENWKNKVTYTPSHLRSTIFDFKELTPFARKCFEREMKIIQKR